MPINIDLLIAAPMLQNYLVNKDTGYPLSGGWVSLYKDNDRQVYKNWYYQVADSSTSIGYSYITLPNPLRLSSYGTIQDQSGNDIIPFYYPYNESTDTESPEKESYYVVITDSDGPYPNGIIQFTRENYPFVKYSQNNIEQSTLRNYIINNVFYNNCGTQSLQGTSTKNLVICPSQHQGYDCSLLVGNSDIRFIKNIEGADDTISFVRITTALENDVTPEYALWHQCSSSEEAETFKYYQYPLSLHLATLSHQTATIVIHAANVGGGSNNYIDLAILQYTGDGAVSSSQITAWGPNDGRLTLTENFQKYSITDIIPSSNELELGHGGDDALFVLVKCPVGVPFSIKHTKLQFYIGDTIPDNNFDTYDQISSITNMPRTGYTQTCQFPFHPYGWLQLDNGTIGNANSNATNRANQDVYQLFKVIWNNASLHIIQPYMPMYASDGTMVEYGSSAIEDFNANRALSLPKAISNVQITTFIGNESFTYNPDHTNSTLTLVGVNASRFGTGTPIVLMTGGTFPTGLAGETTYYSIYVSPTVIKLAKTIANALSDIAIGFSDNGSGIQSLAVLAYTPNTIFGEERHELSESEMPSHHHTYGPAIFDGSFAGGAGSHVISGTANTSSVGNNIPHNTMQPSLPECKIIKL
jgi:hypothetical protein